MKTLTHAPASPFAPGADWPPIKKHNANASLLVTLQEESTSDGLLVAECAHGGYILAVMRMKALVLMLKANPTAINPARVRLRDWVVMGQAQVRRRVDSDIRYVKQGVYVKDPYTGHQILGQAENPDVHDVDDDLIDDLEGDVIE